MLVCHYQYLTLEDSKMKELMLLIKKLVEMLHLVACGNIQNGIL